MNNLNKVWIVYDRENDLGTVITKADSQDEAVIKTTKQTYHEFRETSDKLTLEVTRTQWLDRYDDLHVPEAEEELKRHGFILLPAEAVQELRLEGYFVSAAPPRNRYEVFFGRLGMRVNRLDSEPGEENEHKAAETAAEEPDPSPGGGGTGNSLHGAKEPRTGHTKEEA